MYYVTMTDRFMSGWGPARGTINKLVIACQSYEEAETIERNAKLRSEMRYVNICNRKPSYPRAHVSWKTYEQLGDIWKAPAGGWLKVNEA
jgi:hypothetical protein